MRAHVLCGLLVWVCILGLGCSSSGDDSNTPVGGAGGAGGAAGTLGGAGGVGATGGTSGAGGAGGAAGTMVGGTTGGTAGTMGGASGVGGAGGVGGGGAGGAGGMGDPDAGDDAGGDEGNGSDLSGTLGALGSVKPVLSGWATSNGLETLIYLSSSELTCETMMTMGTPWLSTLPAGTQVIEIVVRGMATVGTTNVGFLAGEINYAEGSKSSSYEVNADDGSITFTKTEAMGVYEGSLMATYPMGMLEGTFHAEWCQGGQEY